MGLEGNGKMIDVPYSKVMDAYKAGYLIDKNDYERYGKDREFDLKKSGKPFNPDTDIPRTLPVFEAEPEKYTLPMVKQQAGKLIEGILNPLPDIGGIGGGLAAGGVGLESGPADVAFATAGATAGGALGEDARQVAERKLHPYAHRLTPQESARKIAVQGGMQGVNELTGRVTATKVIGPAARYFGDTAAASEKAGVDLLPSEAYGKTPSYVEKFLKGSVLTSGKMERFRALQNEQTKTAVNKLADSISNFKGTPEELGKLVQEGIDRHEAQFRTFQNQMYGDIGKAVNERTIKVPVTTTKKVATGVLDQFGKPTYTTSTTTTLQDRVVDDVMPSTVQLKKFAAEELKKLDQVEKILDPNLLGQSRSMLENILKAPNNMPYSAMRSARSDTLAKVRELDQALAGKQAGLAKKMAGLFDDSIMDAVKKSNIHGLEEQVRAADAFTANEHKMFEQQLVKKVVETKKPEAIATLIRNKNMGIQETRDLFSILPKDLHQPVQRQIIVDTMRQSTNNISKSFNERKFAETISNIGDERGKIIFGSNWNNIKEVTSVMERINGPVGIQGGSGAALQNAAMIKNIIVTSAETAAIPLGLIGAHHPIGAVISFGGEWVSLRGLASALTNPATTAKILKAAQVGARALPYAAIGAVNETGGVHKNINRVKEAAKNLQKPDQPVQSPTPKADELQDMFHQSGLAPAPSPSEGATGPQSRNKTHTHVWNPETQTIEAV
jgi:hypothetical protein